MGNQDPNIKEPGFTDLGEEKISQLLSSLPRVEAPGDFGFRVKARIADGRPAQSSATWLPTAVKAAVPLGLAVFVGGYFALTSFYIPNDPVAPLAAVENARPEPVSIREQPIVAQTQPPVVINDVSDGTQGPSVYRERETTVKTSALKRPVNRKTATDNRDSGSYVEAASDARNPSPAADPASKPEAVVKGTPAGEILTRIGVNALFGESGWKAESVSPNTAAARAGVKAGDVIEAVDDQELTDLGSVGKPVTGKKLRVNREGKSVEIVIGP
ncbi:hypothetical protein BH20ACI2_BH20ACI2_00230 [soil metagenome]